MRPFRAAGHGRAPAVFPSEPPVAQQGVDLRMAGHAPQPVVFPEEDGRMAMQVAIGRIRVLYEDIVVRIEMQAMAIKPEGGGQGWGHGAFYTPLVAREKRWACPDGGPLRPFTVN